MVMDPKLYKAAKDGNLVDLKKLLEIHGQTILDQVTQSNLDSCLHIAAAHGRFDFGKEVLSHRPAMVSATNAMKQTPLHIASFHGHSSLVRLMLVIDPSAVAMVDSENPSALLLACRRGHIEVVKLFLDFLPGFIMSDVLRSSWLAAASKGHAEIVKEIVKVQPEAILYVDEEGSSALHLSALNGHTELTKVLLQIESDLCMLQDREGRTPLHLAASKGREPILEMILSLKLDSAWLLTTKKDTILHSCIRSNKFNAFKFIVENFNVHELINLGDSAGNTILHLAAEKEHFEMVKYMLANTSIDVNALNERGLTALDIVTRLTTRNTKATNIYNTLAAKGAKSGRQVGWEAPESNDNEWYLGFHKEHLQNGQNMMAMVSVLTATVAYSAVINPPGGVYQDGKLPGTTIMNNKTLFIVFRVFNDLALFSSLCLITILIFIPKRQQVFNPLLSSAIHTLMWACVAFMAVAYTAASWIIPAPGQSSKKMLVAVTLIGWGTLGSVFVGLLLLMMRRQHMANASHGHRTAT